jgi:hypothetical protein
MFLRVFIVHHFWNRNILEMLCSKIMNQINTLIGATGHTLVENNYLKQKQEIKTNQNPT